MALIEWTRLEGNSVEAVVAMLINRERPNSVRITPSKGDGGVDILERIDGSSPAADIYQVKRYSGPLKSSQKMAIEQSIGRIMSDPRWSNLEIATIHLVTPWDPTPEAYAWLQELAATYQVRMVWHGLTYVEGLGAKFPDVIDYYLHNGSARVEKLIKDVAALMGVESVDPSDIGASSVQIRRAVDALDVDPHYRYEFRYGSGELPELGSRPGLVMTQISGRDGGPWEVIDIIARCAASLQERPITFKGTLTVDPDSQFSEDFDDFRRFGVPFSSPEGAYSGVIDAPGGLGGTLKNASVTVFSNHDRHGDKRELHVDLLSPEGNVVAGADLNRINHSEVDDGWWELLEEVHGVFRVDTRVDHTSTSGTRSITFGDFSGQPATAVHRAMTFIKESVLPNVGRVSVRGTPPEKGLIDAGWCHESLGDSARYIHAITDLMGMLATIQAHTSTLVRVPSLDAVDARQLKEWVAAARLLRGEDRLVSYPEDMALILEVGSKINFPTDSVGANVPLWVNVENQRFDLGYQQIWLEHPELVDFVERDGRYTYKLTTPDRRARFHWPQPGEAGG